MRVNIYKLQKMSLAEIARQALETQDQNELWLLTGWIVAKLQALTLARALHATARRYDVEGTRRLLRELAQCE